MGMPKIRNLLAPALGAIGFCLLLGEAQAQTADSARNDIVVERRREEYEPNGVRLRSFLIRPDLTSDVAYLDNVFAEETDLDDDVVVGLRSNLDVRSTWSRHQLRGGFRSDTLFFTQFGSENRTTYTGDIEGRVDLGRASELGAGAIFQRDVAPRTSPETPLGSQDLVQSNATGFYAFAAHEFNRLRMSARFDRTRFEFDDITTISGAVASLNDRERVDYRAVGRLEYAVSPDTGVFLEGGWNRRDFDVVPASGVARSSEGQTALVGIRTDLGRLLRGEFSVGYLRQDFEAAGVEVVSGVATRVRLQYLPTRLTTVSLTANRRIEDTGVEGGAGIVATDIGLRIDHELRRNLILFVGGGYDRRGFRGLERTDDFINAQAGARYLINRNLTLGADYRFDDGRSDVLAGRNFQLNTFRLSLTVRL